MTASPFSSLRLTQACLPVRLDNGAAWCRVSASPVPAPFLFSPACGPP